MHETLFTDLNDTEQETLAGGAVSVATLLVNFGLPRVIQALQAIPLPQFASQALQAKVTSFFSGLIPA